jgi:hypothetical protein
MIPNAQQRVIKSHGVSESAEFGISVKDSAHIMNILRDTLYSDKILAVLREYGANAWDAHRMAGKPDLPIKVHLPTYTDPVLSIRDFGPGLSRDDVFTVFTQYGASTKRETDEAVGMLGIGSKSGFAYADSFTVISWNSGVKSMYVAALDESDKGVINLLHEEPCGDETGIEIQIAANTQDITDFDVKAQKLYQYFDPRPEINTTFPEYSPARIKLTYGVFEEAPEKMASEDSSIYHTVHTGQWVAVMGCVGYRINLEQLKSDVPRFLYNIDGELHFGIGEVQVNASREELKYSEATKNALITRFTELADEYILMALRSLEDTENPWARRLRAVMLKKIGVPIPAKYDDDMHVTVVVPKPAEGVTRPFTITREKDDVSSIRVTARSRLIVKDTPNTLKGYHFQSHDYLVRPTSKKKLDDDVMPALEALIDEMGIRGIPVVKLSTLPWQQPTRYSSYNEKHRMRQFALTPRNGYTTPYSRNWDPVDRVPTDADVFVIIRNFKAVDVPSFFYSYCEDTRLAAMFGLQVPVIYGYKDTGKKPIDRRNCKGTWYPDWREKFTRSLVTPRMKLYLEYYDWVETLGPGSTYQCEDLPTQAVLLAKNALGIDHPYTQLLRKHGKAVRELDRFRVHDKMRGLSQRVKEFISIDEAQTEVDKLLAKYPLLKHAGVGPHFFIENRDSMDEWIQYIKLVDEVDALKGNK